MKSIYIILFGFTLVLMSCRDTCNKKYGDTFESVTLGNVLIDNQDNKLHLNFGLTVLDDLPEGYFQSNSTEVDSSYILIDSIKITKQSLELIVNDTSLPSIDESNNLLLNINFEDRRTYLDCKHPGMNDEYILEIKGILKQNGDATFSLTDFTWTQYVNMGAI